MFNQFKQTSSRHKVFVSYHHANDQAYRNQFETLFSNVYDIMVSQSVQIGDINENLGAERIRQIIRDEYLKETTVTVVLIGSETWKRKHVDWEIGSSIRDTRNNPRSGLLGILLPSYHDYDYMGSFNPHTIPPRLYDNIQCGFAQIHRWSNDYHEVQQWIHEAFLRRNEINPNNTFSNFVNNRSGSGWQR